MISGIEIRKFRTHKKLDVELGPGVTSIVGESFDGKSTIVRALKWVALNYPAGDKMIMWGEKNVSVRVSIDNKRVIRRKGKIGNLYKLQVRGGANDQVFKAFGNDVPQPIAKHFNLSTINFQGQFEAPFWFCETAGEVSRQLNSIVNLEVIDNTLANITSEIRKTRSAVEVTESRLKGAKEQVEELAYVKEMNKEFKSIEDIQSAITENAVQRSSLQELLKSGQIHQSTMNNANSAAQLGNLALRKASQFTKIGDSAKTLSQLIKTARKHIKVVKNRPPSLAPLQKLRSQYIEANTRAKALGAMVQQMETYEDRICQAKKRKTKLKEQMEKLAGKVCPLCGTSTVSKKKS